MNTPVAVSAVEVATPQSGVGGYTAPVLPPLTSTASNAPLVAADAAAGGGYDTRALADAPAASYV